jgi:ketol-acid reductoisomerase
VEADRVSGHSGCGLAEGPRCYGQRHRDDAATEAALDLFVEQTVDALLGMAIMTAFEVGRDAGLPAEVLVLEMYMSGEMEIVFRSFREAGFFRSSEDHGPTAVFGGMLRTLEMDREALMASFRTILGDIKSGGFAQRFQTGQEQLCHVEMARP